MSDDPELRDLISKLSDKIDRVSKQSVPPSKRGDTSIPPWALGVIAILTAVGAGAGASQLQPKPPDPSPQIDDLRSDIKRVSDDVREIREYLRQMHGETATRWEITEGVLCKLNGGRPYARKVECDALAFEPLPIDKKWGPGWKADADWPFVRRPPQ